MFKFHGNTDSKVNITRKHRRGQSKKENRDQVQSFQTHALYLQC
jgi:hypothetical protein